jgi:hypothetical protein
MIADFCRYIHIVVKVANESVILVVKCHRVRIKSKLRNPTFYQVQVLDHKKFSRLEQ